MSTEKAKTVPSCLGGCTFTIFQLWISFHITPWFEVGVLRGGVGVVMDGDRYLGYS